MYCVYHIECVVRRTNKKVKCTSTTYANEEARDRLTQRRQSLTQLIIKDSSRKQNL